MVSDPLLRRLEELLVAQIPRSVQACPVQELVYCLRIWYCGTDADGARAPFLMLKKESARRWALVEKGDTAPHYIWCADELADPEHVYDVHYDVPEISALCRQWYKRIEDAPIEDGVSEEEGLRPIREMTQRVATRLNKLDWQRITKATDDFVVIPADSSHTFCADYQEILSSIPTERMELLRSRKLLGTRDWYKL